MTKITIIGAGPGGYIAAFDAARRGASVTLIEKAEVGGTCLNWGCIPTKTIKGSAEALETSNRLAEFGIVSEDGGKSRFRADMASIVARKERVRKVLCTGLEKACASLKVRLVRGQAELASGRTVLVRTAGGSEEIRSDAVIIATGSVAMGMDAVIFLTFWGTPLFRKPDKTVTGKDLMSSMFGWMLPKGAGKATLSKMNMGGMGTAMLKDLMKKKNVATLPQMIDMAGQLGVKVFICEMSMDLMGFKREEMIDYPDLKYAGVATFLAEAKNSKVQLFL